jgi:hypothetical protein
MAIKFYINASATNPKSALVQSESVIRPVNPPTFVVSDKVPIELYFVNGTGGFESWSGGGSYTLKVALGTPGAIPTGGTFTLTFGAQTTSALAYNVSAAALQTAFQALSSVGSGNATVTGTFPAYNIEFVGALANTNVGAITTTATSLTPESTVTATVITAGGGGSNEVVQIQLSATPLAYKDTWGTVTNGWSGNLNLSESRLISAIGDELHLDTYIEFQVKDGSGNPQTTYQFPIRVLNEVITGATVTSTAGATSPTDAEADLWYVNNKSAVTGLTGGASTDLDYIVTAGGEVATGTLATVTIDGEAYHYRLVAGTDAESLPAVIRPDDYNASTNARVWKLRYIGREVFFVDTADIQEPVGAHTYDIVGDDCYNPSFPTDGSGYGYRRIFDFKCLGVCAGA